MQFDFDRVITRSGTGCVKWDQPRKQYGRQDLLPLWVADMDFAVPPAVVEAIQTRAEHPIYGYPTPPEQALQALAGWIRQRHGWDVSIDWTLLTGSVVAALNLAVLSYTNRGDKVIIQPPVYGPFFRAVEANGCQVVTNPLKTENGTYVMDLADLEAKIDSRTKMIILCNPHNPVGRVWNPEELRRLGELCAAHGILIVSDDVHSDFVYSGCRYTPIASLSAQLEQMTVTCMAPSKTFNLAGLSTAAVIIPNERLRQTFANTVESVGSSTNIFGVTALEAAYKHGGAWLDQLLQYLERNLDFLCEYVEKRLSGVRVLRPEGTYLVWLDFSGLELPSDRLQQFLVQEAGIVLNEGVWFGEGGYGHARLNIGCPRSILAEGLKRLETAVANLGREKRTDRE